MHENSKARMIFRYYVYEEELELPEELINEMESRIIEAHLHELERMQMEHKRHRGDWLTADICHKYSEKAWIYRLEGDIRYSGKIRELSKALQKLYGVTETQSIFYLIKNI